MCSSLSAGNQRPQLSGSQQPSALTVDGVQAPEALDPSPECTEQKVSSSPRFAAESGESEEMVIASIRVTSIVPSVGRIPIGFYIAVLHSGFGWRTVIKRASMDTDSAEWTEVIPVPSDLSACVHLEIYGSFELQPILGNGKSLRKWTVTAEQLLDHSAQCLPFAPFQENEDVVLPCPAIFVTTRRQKCKKSDLCLLSPHCSSTESQRELEDATDQGHIALSCYEEREERQDLERAMQHFERALNLCPPGHPCRAAAQSNVAEAKLKLYRLDDTGLSLDAPLNLYHSALSLRPVGHLDRPFTLIQLAAVYFTRFEYQGDGGDAAQADALLHEAMDLSPTESLEERLAAIMLRAYAERVDDVAQMGGGPSVGQGSASGSRDVDSIISALEAFLMPTPVLDDKYVGVLADLGVTYLERFHHLGNLSDLENSISTLRYVVDLTPDAHPGRPTYLNNLGNSLQERFKRFEKQTDLEQAILRLKDAVDLASDSHPRKWIFLCDLGSSFRVRFERLDNLNDLDQAISMQKDGIDLAPDGQLELDKSLCLNNLGNSFLSRFRRLGELNDLDQAISAHRQGVDLMPNDHPKKARNLCNLGTSLIIRFERLGDSGDLEQAISMHRDAVDLTSDGQPDKPGYLNSLSVTLLHRFMSSGDFGDLEQAILRQADAVNLTPNGHPNKSGRLSNLGDIFFTRFEHLGILGDLDQAISKFKDALDNIPDDHPDRPNRLNHLGDSFLARFEHLGDLKDLEQAILMQEDAVALAPEGLPNKRRYLNNLANSFCVRFERLGELSDLEQAISWYKKAVRLTPDDHPEKPPCLNNLGSSFTDRFDLLGELTDLEQAISRFGDAIDIVLRLDGQPNKPVYLINLGSSLLTRFQHFGELKDLEQAILKFEDAADCIPGGHPDKPTCLSYLGSSLLARFESLGKCRDLEEAISVHRDAVSLTKDGHVYKPQRLSSLGKSLLARYKLFGDSRDLEQAISKLENATDLIPDDHPNKPGSLKDLGDSARARFEHDGDLSDIEHALSLYSRAARASIGPIAKRFSASLEWISCARILRHHSLLDAYSVAVGLLPQLAWIGHSLARRYHELLQGTDVVREAAAAALDSGQLETAVEWLEQGRSIVWGELFQLRSSYDKLSSTYPDYARRLRELSAALDRAGATREMALSPVSEDTESTVRRAEDSLEQVAERHRTLAIRRDKLLKEIRKLRGFERFLLHREFSQLRASAHSGPVVILNAAESRCDALIVLADVEGAVHVPLPNYTIQRSKGLRNAVKKLLGRAAYRDERDGRPVPQEAVTEWQPILSPLWKCVVKPVLDALAISTSGNPSRIFWCPTGPFTFLPIHAAGFYDSHHSQPGHKAFDFVISSYVPTLSILLPSREAVESGGDLHVLVVRQPDSDGLSRLPGVQAELEHIRTIVNSCHSTQTTLMESSAGTVEEVLDLMKDADWVHFACHGIQDEKNVTESGLCLADGRRLQLSSMITLSRRRGGLAFLSACQTAMGDEDLSDEAIHIAAGMLFAGYGGVVGTMWSISDRLAPRVAKDVYTQLFMGKPGLITEMRQGCCRMLLVVFETARTWGSWIGCHLFISVFEIRIVKRTFDFYADLLALYFGSRSNSWGMWS